MLKTQFEKVLRIHFFAFTLIFFLFLACVTYILYSKGQSFYRHLNSQDIEKSVERIRGKLHTIQKVGIDDRNFEIYAKKLTGYENQISNFSEYFSSSDDFKGMETASKDLDSQIKNLNISNVASWKSYQGSIAGFMRFSISNKWKNLSIISRRINFRSSQKYNLNDNFVEILNSNLKDLNSMSLVVRKSSLRDDRKAQILKRINSLIAITNKRVLFENKFVSAKANFKKLSLLMNNWQTKWGQDKVNPEAMNQFKFLDLTDITLLSLIASLCLLAFFYLSKKTSAFLKTSFEKDSLQLIDKVVVKGDKDWLKNANPQFQTALLTLTGYLNKRMSFGQIFQDTLPFPALLLDQNLMVRWANNPLVESLKVSQEDIKGRLKSWDEINTLFDFNGADPVSDSFNSKQSGIYKFKLKCQDSNDLYEIYVNPITYHAEEFMMVYFNTLTPVQDAINLQVEHVLSSMTAIIENLEDGNLEIEELSNEFDIPGINDVYERLLDFVDYHAKKAQLIETNMTELKKESENSKNTLFEVHDFTKELKDFYQNAPQEFTNMKTQLINLMEGQKIASELNKELLDLCIEGHGYAKDKISSYQKIEYVAQSCDSWLIPELSKLKKEFSQLKSHLKGEGKSFEIFFSKLEVLLGEMQGLNVNFNKLKNSEVLKFSSQDFRNSIELIEKSHHSTEEKIVNSLQTLVSLTKYFGKSVSELEELSAPLEKAPLMNEKSPSLPGEGAQA